MSTKLCFKTKSLYISMSLLISMVWKNWTQSSLSLFKLNTKQPKAFLRCLQLVQTTIKRQIHKQGDSVQTSPSTIQLNLQIINYWCPLITHLTLITSNFWSVFRSTIRCLSFRAYQFLQQPSILANRTLIHLSECTFHLHKQCNHK